MSRWPTFKIKELSTKVGSGATPRGGKRAYKDSGIPLIRSMNVHLDGFRYDGLAFLDKKQAEQLKAVEVRGGDVLLNITGGGRRRLSLEKELIQARPALKLDEKEVLLEETTERIAALFGRRRTDP